jgi:ParB family transcriptional regulator, chromosome partitioning protein
MSIKDLAAKTAGVAARAVEKAPDREPKTAPVRMYDMTQRLHAAESEVEVLRAKLEEERARHGAGEGTSGFGDAELLDVALLDDAPYQSRKKINPQDVDDIGQSLLTAGQRSPITVRRKPNGRYEIIKGHTRKYGAISRDIPQLLGLIVERTDREAKLDLWLDNTGRGNTDYECGLMFREALSEGYASTQRGVGDLFGCSQSKVSKCLAMLDLPAAALVMLEKDPALFGAATAAVIQDLWKKHPDHTDVIVLGLQRVAEGADQNGLTAWVQQQMARAQRTEKLRPRSHQIPHPSGNPAYLTIEKGRDLVLRVVDPEIDMEMMRKAIEETLVRLVKERNNEKVN